MQRGEKNCISGSGMVLFFCAPMKTSGSIFVFVILFLTSISAGAEDALDRWHFRDSRVLSKVRFLNNSFIGVGENGTILTSPDGQMWTASVSGTSAGLNGVAYGNTVPITTNTYVVVGNEGTILM